MNTNILSLGLCMITLCCSCANRVQEIRRPESLSVNQHMYVIERSIPGAGQLTQEELKKISQTANNVLKEMDFEIEWLHSYITGDKIYSIYAAPNEEIVREHARQGGFPVSSIERVSNIIDPSTASR